MNTDFHGFRTLSNESVARSISKRRAKQFLAFSFIAARASGGELVLYEGDGHLFSDPDLADYDERATDQVVDRALAFLAGL